MTKLQLPTKEEILSTWDNCFLENRKLLPRQSGVYILVTGKVFLYIGCSNNIRQRLSDMAGHPMRSLALVHLKPDNVSYFQYIAQKFNLQAYWDLSVNRVHRYQLEALLIRQFKPVANDAKLMHELYLKSYWKYIDNIKP